MAAELVIKINGDISNFKKALSDVEGQTENLSNSLGAMAKTSAIAFAALSAEVVFAVRAFAGQEQAANKLGTALGLQGIYSKQLVEDYKEQASALQDLTGADDDAIIKGQAVLQGFLGQTKVTKELTAAIVDMSVATGTDLETAFQVVGKSIGTNVNALSRQGIEIDVNASKSEKLASVVSQLERRFQGQAEAAAQGIGSFKLMANAVEDLQKAIGARFAPVIESAVPKITAFVKSIADNKPLVDLIASVTTAGLVVAGLGTVAATAGVGLIALRAALLAAGIATGTMGVAVKGLIGATGLGLLVILISEIYLNWSEVWPRMQAAFESFVSNIGALGEGLSQILKGVFTLDTTLITEGLNAAKDAFSTGYDEYTALVAEKKQIAHEDEMAADEERAAELNAKQIEARTQAQIDEAMFQEQVNAIQKSHKEKRIADKANEHVTFLENQKKFGAAYAMIYKVMHSEIFQGTKDAFNEMAAFQQSSNSTLKAIGKAAAVANIIIKTSESAMNIYAGFATIPIIGPALGIAGAAAAVAFGAEQIGRVLGANQGGLVMGGVPGMDSVPAMLTPGELVVPAQNYDEVISAVASQREGGGGAPTGPIEIILSLKDNLVEFVEAGMVERQNLNLSIVRA